MKKIQLALGAAFGAVVLSMFRSARTKHASKSTTEITERDVMLADVARAILGKFRRMAEGSSDLEYVSKNNPDYGARRVPCPTPTWIHGGLKLGGQYLVSVNWLCDAESPEWSRGEVHVSMRNLEGGSPTLMSLTSNKCAPELLRILDFVKHARVVLQTKSQA